MRAEYEDCSRTLILSFYVLHKYYHMDSVVEIQGARIYDLSTVC